MQHVLFAEIDWSQAFTGGIIGGGGVLVIVALVFFCRAMTANREDSKHFDANQSTYMASLLLGIALIIGGLYFRGSVASKTGNSDDLSSYAVFESKDGRFSVSFPGKPKEKSQGVMGMRIKMFLYEEADGAFGVAYLDIPTSTGVSPDKMLTSARDGMLYNMDAKLLKEDRISLRGIHPGREIKADVPSKGAQMFCSIYLVNDRAYQVLILGKPAWLNSDKARKFLNSFKVK